MYRVVIALLAALVCLGAGPTVGQGFDYCADVSQDGDINVLDIVIEIDEHRGGPALPADRGDIDLRQGYTAGDTRYLIQYIFFAAPATGCPPFDPYSLNPTDDTLYLPIGTIPAGTGNFTLPIILVNNEPVTDLVLPFEVSGLDATVDFDSIHIEPAVSNTIGMSGVIDSYGVVVFSGIMEAIEPGLNLLATLHFSYSGSSGATVVSVDTTTPWDHTFLNYVYGDSPSAEYSTLTIGVPTVISSSETGFAVMSVEPESLFFETLVDYPDPDPQQFQVLTNGIPFGWWLTKDDWLSVDKEIGNSGEWVTVTANIADLPVGIHYGEILVYSSEALNSPRTVSIQLKLKGQYPAFDANCDGMFNISDIVTQINYIFSSGVIPCDPCTGEEWKK